MPSKAPKWIILLKEEVQPQPSKENITVRGGFSRIWVTEGCTKEGRKRLCKLAQLVREKRFQGKFMEWPETAEELHQEHERKLASSTKSELWDDAELYEAENRDEIAETKPRMQIKIVGATWNTKTESDFSNGTNEPGAEKGMKINRALSYNDVDTLACRKSH